MSQDRHEPGATEQLHEPRSGEAKPAKMAGFDATQVAVEQQPKPVIAPHTAPRTAEPGFEPVTIRSYLAEQFSSGETATPVQPSVPSAPPTDAKAELAKWRERVPKLAAALKQRATQISTLEAEVAQLQEAAHRLPGADASLKARDEHIAALEHKLEGLTKNYQTSEGCLRAREVELENLRSDLQASKQRWQNVTEALDTQVASTEEVQALLKDAMAREASQQAELEAQQLEVAAGRDALSEAQHALADQHAAQAQLAEQLAQRTLALQESHIQLAGLEERNQNLFETTELANLQLIALSDDVTRLHAEQTSQAQDHAVNLVKQQQQNLLDIAQIQTEHTTQLRDTHAQTVLAFEALEQQFVEEQRRGEAAMQASLERKIRAQELAMHSDFVQLQQAAQGLVQQRNRTQKQLAYEQLTRQQAEEHYSSATLRLINEHQHALANLTLAFETEVEVQRLQLEEQAQLLEQTQEPASRISILGEISDHSAARSDFAQAWRNLDDQSGEATQATNDTILELERLLKIRNEELKAAVASQVHFLPPVAQRNAPNESRSQPEVSSTDAATTIASLQAQISSAQEESAALRRQLERTSAAFLSGDDLTQLKGVGGKLADQLRELGFSRFAQIAALTLAELEAPDHPLCNLKGRVERNGWIEQAQALANPLTLYGEKP